MDWSTPVKRHLESIGYVVIKGILAEEVCKSIFHELSNYCNREGKRAEVNVIEKIESLHSKLFTPQMHHIIEKVLGEFWYDTSDICYEYDNFSLHRDACYRIPRYKLFIPVTDNTQSEGIATFKLVQGTYHINDKYTRDAWNSYSSWGGNEAKKLISTINVSQGMINKPISETEEGVTKIELKLGDAILFNANMLHGLECGEKMVDKKNTFVALGFFPAPSQHNSYLLRRKNHKSQLLIQRMADKASNEYRWDANYNEEYAFSEHAFKSMQNSIWGKTLGFCTYAAEEKNEAIRYARKFHDAIVHDASSLE